MLSGPQSLSGRARPCEAKQCQCAYRRRRWRSPKDAAMIVRASYSLPRTGDGLGLQQADLLYGLGQVRMCQEVSLEGLAALRER